MLRTNPSAACVAGTLLLAASITALPAQAQEIYRWRDADGRMHYADRPPASGAEAQRLNRLAAPAPARHTADDTRDSSESAADSSASEADDREEREAEARASESQAAPAAPVLSAAEELRERAHALDERQALRKREEAAARAAAADAEERQRLCARLANRLAALESGQRVARFGADGGREFLSDDERAEESARLRERIARDCA